jgi:hypothetical protein
MRTALLALAVVFGTAAFGALVVCVRIAPQWLRARKARKTDYEKFRTVRRKLVGPVFFFALFACLTEASLLMAGERGAWYVNRLLNTADAYERYLARYPHGPRAAEAHRRLGDFREKRIRSLGYLAERIRRDYPFAAAVLDQLIRDGDAPAQLHCLTVPARDYPSEYASAGRKFTPNDFYALKKLGALTGTRMYLKNFGVGEADSAATPPFGRPTLLIRYTPHLNAEQQVTAGSGPSVNGMWLYGELAVYAPGEITPAAQQIISGLLPRNVAFPRSPPSEDPAQLLRAQVLEYVIAAFDAKLGEALMLDQMESALKRGPEALEPAVWISGGAFFHGEGCPRLEAGAKPYKRSAALRVGYTACPLCNGRPFGDPSDPFAPLRYLNIPTSTP